MCIYCYNFLNHSPHYPPISPLIFHSFPLFQVSQKYIVDPVTPPTVMGKRRDDIYQLLTMKAQGPEFDSQFPCKG